MTSAVPDTEDDRRLATIPDRFDQLVAGVGADMDVQQHDVDRLRLEMRARSVDRRSLEHAVALELEVDGTEQAKRRVVFDHENSRHRATSPLGHGYRERIRAERLLPAQELQALEQAGRDLGSRDRDADRLERLAR